MYWLVNWVVYLYFSLFCVRLVMLLVVVCCVVGELVLLFGNMRSVFGW